MANTFGVSGLRGEAGVSLTADVVFRFGKFLGIFIRKADCTSGCENVPVRPRVLLGRDTRVSGQMLEAAICAGLMEAGADVFLMGVTTTPSISYITKVDSFDCGVMITASHNPFYDNGIKVIAANGEPMGDIVFEKCFGEEHGEIPSADRFGLGRSFDYPEGREKYIRHLQSVPVNPLGGIRIGLDCANGASSYIAHSVFDALGADVCYINDAPNGYNINEKCGSAHLEVIRKLVLDNRLDAGFSLDGDADRCMAVDSFGNEVTGDHFSLIYAEYLKKRGRLENNVVVGTVVSNLGLKKALEAQGIGYLVTGVGEPLVRKCMVEHGCIVGGEQCGHMVFSEHSTTGDGIITALKMLDVMAETGKSLCELASALKMFPQVHRNIRVTDKRAAVADAEVLATVRRITDALGDMGRVLVRHSDTESLVRIMVESESKELCEKYADEIASVIGERGYVAGD